MSTAEATIKLNSIEYQKHLTTRNRIIRALQFQRNIQTFHSIPKRYRPPAIPELIVPNPDLSQKFEDQYQCLFFQHLVEVITHNTINLELENARLKEIVNRTEQQLSTITAPKEVISHLRRKVYSKNNIEVISQLPSSSTNTTETTIEPLVPPSEGPPRETSKGSRPNKRRISSKPSPRKMKKLQQHFLSQDPNHKPQS